MKKSLLTILSVLLLITLLASGCGSILVTRDGEKTTGETETRHYDYSDFTRLDIGTAFEYEIQQADTYSISITTGSNIFDDIRVTKTGQTLNISMKSPGVNWSLFRVQLRLKAVITMPRLESLEISGASRGIVTGFQSEDELDITVSGASSMELIDMQTGDVSFDVSGASKINGNLVAGDIDLFISGASNVQLKGTAERMDINCSGASTLRLADMKAVDADIILSSASRAMLNLTGKLNLDVSGASRLEYSGDPVLGKTSVTGASTLSKK